MTIDDDPPHGTTYRYRGKGCRCEDCRAAWRRSLQYNRHEPDDPLDHDDDYARSHGIPEADVRNPATARALHRGRFV